MDPIHWTPEQQNANDSKKLSLGILSAVQDSADRTESGLVGLQDAIHTSTQESTDVIASLLDQATSDQRVGINKLEEIKSSSLVSNQILKVIAGKDNSDVVEKLTSIESILSIPEKETDLSPVVIAQNEGVSAITSAIGTLTEAVNNKEYPQFPDIPEQKETVKIDGEVKVSKPSWYSPVDLSGIKTTLEKIAGKEMPKFEFPDFKKILSPIQSILEKIAEKKIPEIPMKDGYIKVTVDRVGGGGLSQPESIALRAVATEETLAGQFAIQLDDVSTTGVTYIGKAAIGSSASSAVWQIKKIDETGTPIDMVITWADGNANFDNIWSNRLSLTYA